MRVQRGERRLYVNNMRFGPTTAGQQDTRAGVNCIALNVQQIDLIRVEFQNGQLLDCPLHLAISFQYVPECCERCSLRDFRFVQLLGGLNCRLSGEK